MPFEKFGVYAKRIGVCGNITHHAVEMFLKGGLARYRTLSELRAMGHNLKKIWRAFKTDFPILPCFDTIKRSHSSIVSRNRTDRLLMR